MIARSLIILGPDAVMSTEADTEGCPNLKIGPEVRVCSVVRVCTPAVNGSNMPRTTSQLLEITGEDSPSLSG